MKDQPWQQPPHNTTRRPRGTQVELQATVKTDKPMKASALLAQVVGHQGLQGDQEVGPGRLRIRARVDILEG